MAEEPRDLEEAARRIAEYGHGDPVRWVGELGPPQARALVNLDRLLRVSGNPDTRLRLLSSHPPLAWRLFLLLGAGRRLPDALLQSPELADWIIDPERPPAPPSRESIEEEARRQVTAAHSYAHRLDRLRYVKQKWNLAIALADLSREWPAQQVWHALSDLASALLRVARDVVWEHYRTDRDLGDLRCPVVPVAMGKLGGGELNYSSDVDLLFVLDDEADETLEKHASRYCEALRRAIDEPMGRGSLYRVDLRLRPYGGAGPIVSRWRALESYYRLYSEPWEQLALIRSKPLDPEAEARWEALRDEVCFRRARGEWFFEEIVAMRARTESHGSPDDLKRGPGGVRDVEMLVQALQVLGGHAHPELKTRPTLEVLRALVRVGALSEADADTLERGYVLLRQVEHRCQILDDRQTHRLPEDAADRLFIAETLGFSSVHDLEEALADCRSQVREVYSRLFPIPVSGPRSADTAEFEVWLRRSPSPESLREAIEAGGGGRERLSRLAREAPLLVERLAGDAALTESILTGEIEESVDVEARILSSDNLGRASGALHATWATQRVLSGRATFELAALFDAQIAETCRRAAIELDIVALGSYAGGSLGYESDADLLLLSPDRADHSEAEAAAERFLAQIEGQHQEGSPLVLDLRLRPEGRKGLLVIPPGGLEAYSEGAMEWWERFALGRSRTVTGDPAAARAVERAAYAKPLDGDGLAELLAMKHRIETERAPSEYDPKLGRGGMTDLEWAIQLLILRHCRERPPREPGMPQRIRFLASGGLIGTAVADRAIEAWEILDRLRFEQAVSGAVMTDGSDGAAASVFAFVRSFFEGTIATLVE